MIMHACLVMIDAVPAHGDLGKCRARLVLQAWPNVPEQGGILQQEPRQASTGALSAMVGLHDAENGCNVAHERGLHTSV